MICSFFFFFFFQAEDGIRDSSVTGVQTCALPISRHAEAKIRVRHGCYRYLVWRDGLEKREFYLGKIKNLTPQFSRAAAGLAAADVGAGDRQAGVRKDGNFGTPTPQHFDLEVHN